ncbi:MAG: exodeoxyribonuclease VII large subunit [Desulfobacterales bacterium]|nr:exodeoxyribonuclease VII large subunit [Desulfobacterales bacterium]
MKTEDLIFQKQILSVSDLTSKIKKFLENNFSFVWISGEISNFSSPVSGHYYFTLKDENAQINCVMFKGQNILLRFRIENGMNVTGFGRISVYPPRGTYQLIFEHLEPKGLGDLQKAFEQLKKKLHKEGLFDDAHKRSIPCLPQKICIITSLTGAVIHDILKIIDRRFPNVSIKILPVLVQGKGAEIEIASALEFANNCENFDVIIIARGGGSLEDLQAFNTEIVARSIFNSKIPIISAVGHETDYTIADFVADLRAPTPSAAAELAFSLKNELKKKCDDLFFHLNSAMQNRINRYRTTLKHLLKELIDPNKKIQEFRLRIDDFFGRITHLILKSIKYNKEKLEWRSGRLYERNPIIIIKSKKERLNSDTEKLIYYFRTCLKEKKSLLKELTARLYNLNPKSILSRGYSIATTTDKKIILNENDVTIGQKIELVLYKGSIICNVEGKSNYETD